MSHEPQVGGGYQDRTITAFFDDRGKADRAVERLISAGIPRADIRAIDGQNEGGNRVELGASDRGGFWDALADLFMPEEDRYTYAEGLRRGGYLVSVTAGAEHYDQALDILDDEGTIDIGEREQSWRAEGWGGYKAGSSEFTSATARSDLSGTSGTEEIIPVAEEKLRVGKRDVSHGRVRVRSYVVETPVSEQVSLREENVTVQRRAVDRPLTGSDRLFEDRTIEVEERGEEAVVAKEARVREELIVNKEVAERTETISDTVRRTEVEIEDERGLQNSAKAGAATLIRAGGPRREAPAPPCRRSLRSKSRAMPQDDLWLNRRAAGRPRQRVRTSPPPLTPLRSQGRNSSSPVLIRQAEPTDLRASIVR